MIQLRKCFNKKGQGIVEYAVLLAFIVGLAVFLNGGGIGNGVQGVFDNMAAFLRGDEQQGQGQSGYVAWNKRGKNQLHNYETGEDLVDDARRIEYDQAALANIAGFFIGKTKAEVKAAIANQDGTNNNGTVLLDYKDWTEESSYKEGDIKTGLSDVNGAVDRTNGRIYNWMQGDYGSNGSYNSDYDYQAGERYLVSNYMINPKDSTPSNLQNDQYIDNRTVRVQLKYSGSGNNQTVSEARVYVTRGSRSKDNSGIYELDVTMDSNKNVTKTNGDKTGTYNFNKGK